MRPDYHEKKAPLFGRRELSVGLLATPVMASAARIPGSHFTERNDMTIAKTTHGPVRGATTGDVTVFKGIRYGDTTAGRRFLPPRPPHAWHNVADATALGAQCPQIEILLATRTLFADTEVPQTSSEDCLFLNVWTHGLRDGKKRPVMVWLHGGGFVAGSGGARVYDGTRLVDRGDVVVVSINHRLNIFGYLYLAEIGGKEFADSGNVGMLDIVLALQWVRDNIAGFGGDPDNVTIFGESGGGYKVSTLMAMPSAHGLFHKAIVQSGGFIFARTLEAATAYARKFLEAVDLRDDQLHELATMPADVLMTKLQGNLASLGLGLSPVVDGRALPAHPFDPAPEISKSVPLLIGTNKDEATITADPSTFSLRWEDLDARIRPALMGKDPGSTIAALRSVYPCARPSDIYFTVMSWAMMRRNSVIQAERKGAQGGAPAFMYLLAWETPVEGGKWKSIHGVDLPMVFDNVATTGSMAGAPAPAQPVADAMSTSWIRFARDGNPGWPSYAPDHRATMVFNSSSKVVDDPDGDERALLHAPPTPSPGA